MRRFTICKPLSQFLGIRNIRTLTKPKAPGMVDIESQLASYPPEARSEILSKIHQLGPVDKSKLLDEDQYYASIISDYLVSAESPNDLDEKFWTLVKSLAKSCTKSKSITNTELFVQLFEAAKLIEDAKLRQDMIYEIGQYIYRQKRVRFDAVNEVEFLDSLVAKQRQFKALKLWNSRRDREDVAGSTFWLEVGILYHLDASLLYKANNLAQEFYQSMPNEMPVRVIVALINALTLQIQRGKSHEKFHEYLHQWVDVLLSTSKTNNIDYFESALHAVILARNWKLAARILEAIPIDTWSDEAKVSRVSQALLLSASSKGAPSKKEEDFMPFFETILHNIPQLVVGSTATGSLILYFARIGDELGSTELLAEMEARGVELPKVIHREIIKSLLRSQADIEIEGLLNKPSSFIEVLRYNHRRNKPVAPIVKEYFEKNGELTPKIGLEILSLQSKYNESLLDDSRILKLGFNSVCRNYLWYLSAKGKFKISPEELAKSFNEPLTTEILLSMCQAFCNYYPDFEVAVSKLIQALNEMGNATPAQATLVLGTLKKLQAKYRFPLRAPKHPGTPETASNEQDEYTLTWKQVGTQAAAFLDLPNLNFL